MIHVYIIIPKNTKPRELLLEYSVLGLRGVDAGTASSRED
jgi:hypothetical protein